MGTMSMAILRPPERGLSDSMPISIDSRTNINTYLGISAFAVQPSRP